MLGPLGEVREVLIREVDHPALHVFLSELDEELADSIADAARAAVEDEPDVLRLVEADLDEVVAGAEGAEVVEIVALSEARMLRDDLGVLRLEASPRVECTRLRIAPSATVVA